MGFDLICVLIVGFVGGFCEIWFGFMFVVCLGVWGWVVVCFFVCLLVMFGFGLVTAGVVVGFALLGL